jgi:hypothetical protein
VVLRTDDPGETRALAAYLKKRGLMSGLGSGGGGGGAGGDVDGGVDGGDGDTDTSDDRLLR